MRTLIKLSLGGCLVAALGVVGCSVASDEESAGSADEVVASGDISQVLRSTLFLESGCTAAKVGPKHVLVAARCVAASPTMFAAGKVLKFTTASSGPNGFAAAASDAGTRPSDAGASRDSGASDSGSRDAAARDAGNAGNAGNAAARDATIAEVKVHPSFTSRCRAETCGFNRLEASDAPDVAVILLTEDLQTVPTIPVDLDPVGEADAVLAVNSQCDSFEARITAPARASRTMAVPARSASHVGSPYRTSPELVTRLASSYVLTPGPGWRAGDPRLCRNDIGAPLFRAGSAAVAGVTSNFTTTSATRLTPVTTHHTRVDSASRFKIGDWLTELGVETIHSCSESAGGCVRRVYDGGLPPEPAPGETEPGSDGGAGGDAMAPEPEEPTGPREDQLPSEEPEYDYGMEEDYSDAAAPRKKKKAAEGGCSAAPGHVPAGELSLGIGLALATSIVRRRRVR